MDRYAVIGHPVAHSRSPQIHAAFAAATGEQLTYDRLPAPLDGFAATVAAFAQGGGRGLNVTVPFKLEALALAYAASERAQAAGAANTLRRDAAGWYADNTDGAGIIRDLSHNLGVTLQDRDVLVLGAGGAARGVVLPLLACAPRSLTITNRTAERALTLAQHFAARGPITAAPLDALAGRDFDVVINATSAGLSGDVALPWPRDLFRADAFAYDMIYADVPTAFLCWAGAQGASRSADGLGMLVEQAAESFLLWRGVRPPTAAAFAMLRQAQG